MITAPSFTNKFKTNKMKKLALLFLASVLVVLNANAQRFGVGKNQDNTGRVVTYNYAAVDYASHLYHKPNTSYSYYKVGTLTGALTDSIKTTSSVVCDEVTLMFLCDTLTAGRVVTFGNGYKSAGTLTVAKSKRASITFVFDGTYFVEKARAKE